MGISKEVEGQACERGLGSRTSHRNAGSAPAPLAGGHARSAASPGLVPRAGLSAAAGRQIALEGGVRCTKANGSRAGTAACPYVLNTALHCWVGGGLSPLPVTLAVHRPLGQPGAALASPCSHTLALLPPGPSCTSNCRASLAQAAEQQDLTTPHQNGP